MLSDKDSATLHDMLHHIDLAERFVQGRSYETLRDELMPLYQAPSPSAGTGRQCIVTASCT
jgi:phenylalanyl-tRNA synthetase beta subunit